MRERIERFADKVDKQGHDECWEWTGAKTEGGYGVLRVSGVTVRAHRLSWQFFFGEIPEGQQVLHKCDNPGCVNPYHLFLGTGSDNIQDAYKKGRGSSQKLGVSEVKQIRHLHSTGNFSQVVLASMFNIAPSSISLVCSRKTYDYIK